MKLLKIRNWDRFQGYRKRGPQWIKLHTALISDAQWLVLPFEAKGLLPYLWIAASFTEDGTVPSDPALLSMLCRLPESVVRAGLPHIVGTFATECEQSVASVATECEQSVGREEERRVEERREEPPEGKLVDEIPCPTCGRVGYLTQQLARGQHPAGFWCRRPGGCGGNFPLLLPAIVSQLAPNAQNAIQSIAAESAKGVGAKARRRAPSWDSGASESDPAIEAALRWISEHWEPGFEPRSRDDIDALLTGFCCPPELSGSAKLLLLAREYPHLRDAA